MYFLLIYHKKVRHGIYSVLLAVTSLAKDTRLQFMPTKLSKSANCLNDQSGLLKVDSFWRKFLSTSFSWPATLQVFESVDIFQKIDTLLKTHYPETSQCLYNCNKCSINKKNCSQK